MRLSAPLNSRDSYRPPPDALEECWRGFQEVGEVQEGALVEGSEGKRKRRVSPCYWSATYNFCITVYILNACLLHYAFISNLLSVFLTAFDLSRSYDMNDMYKNCEQAIQTPCLDHTVL